MVPLLRLKVFFIARISKRSKNGIFHYVGGWSSKYVLGVPRNISLNFGQNRISNSRDIADLDKCHRENVVLTIVTLIAVLYCQE